MKNNEQMEKLLQGQTAVGVSSLIQPKINPGSREQDPQEARIQEIKNTRKQGSKSTRTQEIKNNQLTGVENDSPQTPEEVYTELDGQDRDQESKKSSEQAVNSTRLQDIKKATCQGHKKTRNRTEKKAEPSSLCQENKKSRATTSGGIRRCPANITIREDYQIALNVIAARRRVRMWTLLDEAIGRYLKDIGYIDKINF